MRPIYKIIELIDSATGICQQQNVPGFGIFDLNGVDVSNGVAVIPSTDDIEGQQITLNTDAVNTGEIIIDGTDPGGNSITEIVEAPSTGGTNPVISTKFFTTVTQVSVDLVAATNVDIGWEETGDAVTAPLPVNWRQGPANITLAMEPYPDAGTDNTALSTMQYSLDDPEDPAFPSYNNDASWRSPTPLTDGSGNGLPGATDTRLEGPVRAVRGLIEATAAGAGDKWRYIVIQGENV